MEYFSTARVSSCNKYRYWLERRWSEKVAQVFVMLNPSTAGMYENDRTIERCINFAKREGAGGIIVVNLYPLRSKYPKQLYNPENSPMGSHLKNSQAIGEALEYAYIGDRPVICAWGANKIAERQVLNIKSRAAQAGVKLVCFALNKSGSPKHPLYVKGDAPLIVFN